MPIDTSGIDELSDKLDEIKDSVNNIDGQSVSFNELFSHDFMRRYTDADDIDEFFERSPWTVESEEDFEAIPQIEMDRYVDNHSEFRTWEQMKTAAGNLWVENELDF